MSHLTVNNYQFYFFIVFFSAVRISVGFEGLTRFIGDTLQTPDQDSNPGLTKY